MPKQRIARAIGALLAGKAGKAKAKKAKPQRTESRTIALAISGLEVPVELRRHRSARRSRARASRW